MKTTLFALGALLAVVAGCDSQVVGGGGGAGGGSGGSGPTTATSTGTSQTTGGGSTAETTGTSTGTTSGPGGTGGGNTLGNCEQGSGTSAASSGGSFMCQADFTCDGGEVSVSCVDDGVTNTCDCVLDGVAAGSCDAGDDGCSFPLNCCYGLLGGVANPNPGPYGVCEGNSGSATTGTGSGAACSGYYSCEGGELSIDCEESDAGASCTCKDGQGFTLGTCGQDAATCEYESSCCYAIFNP